jgi:hypothetical protein
MKNLLSLSPSKILMVCGLGLMTVLGSFWHQQSNQTQLDKMNVLNQGIGTCYNRVAQTFTATMIRDVRSPYLHKDFMNLTDECISETIKTANPFRQNVDKGYEVLNRLHSEASWFHEKVGKTNLGQNPTLAPISERFVKIENLRTELTDLIDATANQLNSLQMNDEILMGAGLIVFVLSLSLLSLQEFNRIQLQREIEKQALNYLKTGQANVGAIVDQLVERALTTQNMPVTAQIFKDYHGDFLERQVSSPAATEVTRAPTPKVVEAAAPQTQEEEEEIEVEDNGYKTSLKTVLVSLQKIHPKDLLQVTDVRDVQVAVESESVEQMVNAAVNKLAAHRQNNKRIMISNQVHSDRTIVNLFLANATFNASELEFSSNDKNQAADSVDMNLLILREMVQGANAGWHLENKTDRNGKLTGMNIRLVLSRVQKEKKSKNLISVVRGKKKDLMLN